MRLVLQLNKILLIFLKKLMHYVQRVQIRIINQDSIQTVTRNREKSLHQNWIERACFESVRCLYSVPVHWVTYPSYNLSCSANGPDQMWKLDSYALSTHSDYDCYSSRPVNGIQDLNQINKFIRIHLCKRNSILANWLGISCQPLSKAWLEKEHICASWVDIKSITIWKEIMPS